MLIVDSTFMCHVRGDIIIKITDKTEKSRILKDKAIVLVDMNMKKHIYLVSDILLSMSHGCSLFLQTGED